MKLLLISLFTTFTLLSGCTHLQSVSTSSVPVDRSQVVRAESYRFIFLAFNFNNDYVDEMAEDLARQCMNGRVEGVLSKQENIVYFPLFAHAVRITAEGYCVRKPKKRGRA